MRGDQAARGGQDFPDLKPDVFVGRGGTRPSSESTDHPSAFRREGPAPRARRPGRKGYQTARGRIISTARALLGPDMENTGVIRKLAVILAADVVGYSRLMTADEEGTLAILNARREVIDELIARHHGRIFTTA